MSPVHHAPTRPTAGEDALRARYLTEVLDVLYPDSTVSAGAFKPAAGRPPNTIAEYLVIPDARRPRLLVPAGDRRLAASAVRCYVEPASRAARLKHNAVVAALRTGASGVLLRDKVRVTSPLDQPRSGTSIETHLAEVFGADLFFSVHIGPPRASRKPVLQLLDRQGETVGFVKLGTGTLTRSLVRSEATALIALSHCRLRDVVVPKVLHAGQWRGHEVLIQSALPTWRPRTSLSTARMVAAMRTIAGCLGVHSGTLAGDLYWKSLRTRLDALVHRPVRRPTRAGGTDAAAEARTLALAADLLITTAGQAELSFGSWHGDWTPWNMASTSAGLLVWDWERFTPEVPVGFDALHYDLQRMLDRGISPGTAVDAMTARAHRLLAPFGTDRDVAQVTALLYLIELAARYLEDRPAKVGARLGVLGNWLLPVLTTKVATLVGEYDAPAPAS